MALIYGLITGIIFGFLLQKAQVLRYDKQVGALRLIDMTILKFMLSAIVVASIGTSTRSEESRRPRSEPADVTTQLALPSRIERLPSLSRTRPATASRSPTAITWARESVPPMLRRDARLMTALLAAEDTVRSIGQCPAGGD